MNVVAGCLGVAVAKVAAADSSEEQAMRIVVYPNETRSAHVHVIGNRYEAVFQLDHRSASIALRENYGFSIHDLDRLQGVLLDNFATISKAWEGVHGAEPGV
jgi:hypothetical protein